MAVEIKSGNSNNEIETPTQEVLKKANKNVEVTSSDGRIFKIKKAGLLARARLFEVLGDAASNQMYLSMILPLIYIISINGLPAPGLSSKLEIEGFLEVVGEEGLVAVSDGLKELGVIPKE